MMRTKGFTLVEIVVVVAMLAITCGAIYIWHARSSNVLEQNTSENIEASSNKSSNDTYDWNVFDFTRDGSYGPTMTVLVPKNLKLIQKSIEGGTWWNDTETSKEQVLRFNPISKSPSEGKWEQHSRKVVVDTQKGGGGEIVDSWQLLPHNTQAYVYKLKNNNTEYYMAIINEPLKRGVMENGDVWEFGYYLKTSDIDILSREEFDAVIMSFQSFKPNPLVLPGN